MRVSLASTPTGDRVVAETPQGYHLMHGPSTSHGPATGLSDVLGDTDVRLGDVTEVSKLRAAVTPGKIIAIGLNYRDHIAEVQAEPPAEPLIFAKFPSTIIGDGDPIVINPSITERVDWEVELAVVIGTHAKDVDEESALTHVFGYSVANDVSARDVQFSDGQWIRGKNLDTFCPLGNVIVTTDEIRDPQTLNLRTRVNGEVMQSSSTELMIFSVAELISYCSRHFALEPGDVLLTGTPWGCGEFMSPRRSLHAGDVVEVWVDGVDTLRNPVISSPVAASASASRA